MPKKQTKAGRPKGTGKFKCQTKTMRVPTCLVDDIMKFIAKRLKVAVK
jgi:hypothetical protein